MWVDLQDVEYSRRLLDAANTVVPSISEEFFQSSSLGSIAEAYGKLGDAEKGKQLLEKALEPTKSIKGELFNVT